MVPVRPERHGALRTRGAEVSPGDTVRWKIPSNDPSTFGEFAGEVVQTIGPLVLVRIWASAITHAGETQKSTYVVGPISITTRKVLECQLL